MLFASCAKRPIACLMKHFLSRIVFNNSFKSLRVNYSKVAQLETFNCPKLYARAERLVNVSQRCDRLVNSSQLHHNIFSIQTKYLKIVNRAEKKNAPSANIWSFLQPSFQIDQIQFLPLSIKELHRFCRDVFSWFSLGKNSKLKQAYILPLFIRF